MRLLEKLTGKLREGTELVAAGGAVEKLRRVKDAEELEAIAAAAELADEVWRWSLERGLAGRSEREVARAAEARIRELGGDPSFPAIVAAGPNGALPHAEPGEREIGARRAGRLRHGREARRLLLRRHPHLRHRRAGGARPAQVYEVVREAQAAALDAVAAGVGGEELDARRARRGSRRPATGSTSATGSATASGSRSTRRRASRRRSEDVLGARGGGDDRARHLPAG